MPETRTYSERDYGKYFEKLGTEFTLKCDYCGNVENVFIAANDSLGKRECRCGAIACMYVEQAIQQIMFKGVMTPMVVDVTMTFFDEIESEPENE